MPVKPSPRDANQSSPSRLERDPLMITILRGPKKFLKATRNHPMSSIGLPLIVLEVDMMGLKVSFGQTGHQPLDGAP